MNEFVGAANDPLNAERKSQKPNYAAVDKVQIGKTRKLIRVLIIDGHKAVRQALQIRLSVPNHFDVVGVSPDPNSAADIVRSAQPDVIVLGLHRSSDEEMEIVVQSVSDFSKRVAVVIVLAPYADALERERLIRAGAKRYLLKHINSDQLIKEIEASVSWPSG